MKNLLTILIVFSWATCSICQKNDYLWLFGYKISQPHPEWGGCVLDFNSDLPSVYKQEREMNFNVTVSSICDSVGNLLLYTNGAYIANFNHEMVENGDSLNPGQITWNNYESGLKVAQSHIFLPKPESPGIYFLFHERIDYHDDLILAVNPCYYTVVDMNENGGLGKVLEKNVVIFDEPDKTFGTMTAVKHANGRDWWVLFPEKAKNVFYRFLFSADGVEDLQILNLSPAYPSIISNAFIAFSPDGSKLARYEIQHGLYLYNFDRCTGTLENNPLFIPIPDTELGGGVAFSPNGRFVYMLSATFILQADTWTNDIASSIDTVAIYDGYTSPWPTTFFTSQLGPDGRIYINTSNGTDILHYINQPNRKGDSCQVVQHGLKLAARNRFTSPHFPNFRLGPLDGSPCDTLGLDNHPLAGFTWEADTTDGLLVQFVDNSFYEPENWLWDFGGTGSSTEVDPQHTFPSDGTYTVCLTVSNQYDSDTFCREVTVSDLKADFDFEPEQLAVQFADLSTSQPNAWRWDFGDGDTSILQNPLHVYAGAGIYEVCMRASDEFGSDVTCREVDVVVSGTGEVNRGGTGVLTLVPNPASGLVTGYLPQKIDGGTVVLTDNMGRTQITVELANDRTSEFSLDLRQLNPGVYHCSVRSTNGQVFSQRIVIH